MSLQAAALGIRTPRILGVAEAGIDGMVLAYEAIDGVSADLVDDIDDDALDALYMSEERPDWLMRRVRSWYRLSERYADVIDDARNGEKSWT